MACACKGNAARPNFEVVVAGGTGKVAFTSSSKATAASVGRRYPDSVIRLKGTREVVQHLLAYEVVEDAGSGITIYASASEVEAFKQAEATPGSIARHAQTGVPVSYGVVNADGDIVAASTVRDVAASAAAAYPGSTIRDKTATTTPVA